MINLLFKPESPESLEHRIAPATFLVTTLSDAEADSTLRDAIEKANAAEGPDTIQFSGVHGTIKLSSDLPNITDSVTISGPSSAKLTIDGNQHQLIHIVGTALDVAISGLKLTRGNAANGGGVFVDDEGGTVTLDKVTIIKNVAVGVPPATADDVGLDGQGGGIFVQNGSVTVSSSKITGNKAASIGTYDSRGGGIYIYETGSVALTKSVVSRNTSATGGGIANFGSLTIDASIISKNIAQGLAGSQGSGGGIYNGGIAKITHSKITGNKAIGGAGAAAALYSGYYGSGGTEAQTTGKGSGGGIFNTAKGQLTLESSKVTGNQAIGGKGAAGTKGDTGDDAYYDSKATKGEAGGAGYQGGSGTGGGIANDGTLTVQASKISGNHAIGGKGGNGGKGGKGGAGADGNDASMYEGKFHPATPGKPGAAGGAGGKGGAGGSAIGGGIYDSTGNAVIIQPTKTSGNFVQKGAKGANGAVGAPGAHGKAGSSKPGGDYYGGY